MGSIRRGQGIRVSTFPLPVFRKLFFGEMTPPGKDPIDFEFLQAELNSEDASELVGIDADRVSIIRSHRFRCRDRFIEAVRDLSKLDRGWPLPGAIDSYYLPENAIVFIANSRIATNDLNHLDSFETLARAIDVLDQDVALS